MCFSYVGAYLLTRALLPLLKRTAQEPNSDVRIVFVRPSLAPIKPPLNVPEFPQVNSARHRSCPFDVRFRNIDDFNRDFEDTMFPQLLRYGAFLPSPLYPHQ